ncbi:MAG TPA: urate hydroxylase PuuD [Kofleriaceae bacterium]|nr:urate hydroxylase PuuD [Kofleriaceae bacterium]
MSLHELFDVIFRWAHVIAGIMWIGNSMLFNWLDRNLEKSADLARLSQGKLYMVHSGAFYDVEKKLLEPGEMPATLHWFKWQNFTTWATGICLLVVVYYLNGAAFLVDPSLHDVSPLVAISISLSALFVAWIVYDGVWDSLGKSRPRLATALSIAMLFGAIYGFSRVFSGRAAYIETGVLIGTLMTGNVWFVIVPSQHALVAATKSGQPQDPALSIAAKQRSIHNNYLTFPLLFIMVSNHFPAATTHHLNWLILIAVIIGGAGVRHFMNIRYLGAGRELKTSAWLAPAVAMAAVAAGGLMIVSRVAATPKYGLDHPVTFARVQEIIGNRCVRCHSLHPADEVFTAAPVGVMFDTPDQIQLMAPRIKYRAYELANMPFNNKTQISDGERAELAAWVDAGAPIK